MTAGRVWRGRQRRATLRDVIRPMLAVLALPLVLTGCASGGASSSGYTSVQQIRDKLDKAGVACTSYEQNKEVLGAREDGGCTTDGGDQLTITIYNTAEQRDKIGAAFALLHSGIDIVGDKWVVNVPTQDEANAVKKAIGGTVK